MKRKKVKEEVYTDEFEAEELALLLLKVKSYNKKILQLYGLRDRSIEDRVLLDTIEREIEIAQANQDKIKQYLKKFRISYDI